MTPASGRSVGVIEQDRPSFVGIRGWTLPTTQVHQAHGRHVHRILNRRVSPPATRQRNFRHASDLMTLQKLRAFDTSVVESLRFSAGSLRASQQVEGVAMENAKCQR